MKIIEFEDKVYNIPECWDDVTLKIYIRLAKLEEIKNTYTIDELYLIKVIECLCDVEDGDLDDLTIDILNEISKYIIFVQDEQKPSNAKIIKIGDTIYSFPSDLNKLTIGEYVSIKTLQENSKSQAEIIPDILSIILRPADEVKDSETGVISYKQKRFDALNMEYRKELFMDIPVMDLIGPINFFLNGNK